MGTYNTVANAIGTIGGVIGLVFGALGIWYARAAHIRTKKEHDIILERFKREEEERQVQDRRDELMRLAYEQAQQVNSPTTVVDITLKLNNCLDKKTAWRLVKEGVATVKDNECTINVNKIPLFLRPSGGPGS